MSEPIVMVAESEVIAAVKGTTMAVVSIFGALYAGLQAVTGVEGSNTLAIGTTLGVSVTFAGLILRMVIKNQSEIWKLVRSRERELIKKEIELTQGKLDKEYVTWEREQARFRAGERMDPGPYSETPALLRTLERLNEKSEKSERLET